MGPDLSAVGTTMPIERMIEEVLWPARNIKEGYTLLRIATRDGRVLQGYPRKGKNDGNDLVLLDAATSELRRIPKKQIALRREGGTAMPEGLAAGMTPSELRDLIRYLSGLGEVD